MVQEQLLCNKLPTPAAIIFCGSLAHKGTGVPQEQWGWEVSTETCPVPVLGRLEA